MVMLPQLQNTTLSKLNQHGIAQELRPYLGMSEIGHPCARYLWYYLHWCFENKFDSRILRLFARGHREEPSVYAELKKIGVHVHSDQVEITGAHGHCRGHNDGIAENVPEAPKTPHLLEIKTHSDKMFKALLKGGVEKAMPKHYAQMQRYMKGLHLTRGLYYAVNKNDDTVFIERIDYDADFAAALVEKETAIVEAEYPPEKIGGPDWYQCKFCSANDICHYDQTLEINCRTCESHEIRDNGEWHCSDVSRNTLFPPKLTEEQQRLGCNHYSLMECLS